MPASAFDTNPYTRETTPTMSRGKDFREPRRRGFDDDNFGSRDSGPGFQMPRQFGGPPRPADRAGDDPGGAGLGQCAQAMPDRLCLRNAAGGQRRVAPSLVTPREVPFGLAVPDEEDRHRRMR